MGGSPSNPVNHFWLVVGDFGVDVSAYQLNEHGDNFEKVLVFPNGKHPIEKDECITIKTARQNGWNFFSCNYKEENLIDLAQDSLMEEIFDLIMKP